MASMMSGIVRRFTVHRHPWAPSQGEDEHRPSYFSCITVVEAVINDEYYRCVLPRHKYDMCCFVHFLNRIIGSAMEIWYSDDLFHGRMRC